MLRAVEPSDLEFLYALENDTRLWPDSSTTVPYSRHQLREYIANASADIYVDRQIRLIITDDENGGVPVGAVDLYDFDPINMRAAVGIAVIPSKQRKGIGGKALDTMIRYATERLGLNQIWAETAVDNEPSRRLFAAAGFKPAGRLSRWIRRGKEYVDADLWQKLL